MCFPTCSALGSFFLVASFILELFLIIGQLSSSWFLTKLYFAQAWNNNQNLSYSFGLWNYCTGDGNRNIQSCARPVPAYNWAKTPVISDLVPNLANSAVVSGLFYALFILIFVAMGLSFIFWLMSLPICCTRHKRAWGYSMSTLCLINFLITLVSVILALILILAGVRQLTGASPDWHAHAGNSLWVLIGACIANFVAMMCYSGGACCSRSSRRRNRDDDYSDDGYYATGAVAAPVADETGKKKKGGLFSRFGRKNKAQVDPAYKETSAGDDTTNYNNLLPGTAQPMYSHSSPYTGHQNNTATPHSNSMLQQPYAYNDPTTPVQHNATGVTQNTTGIHDRNAAAVPAHGYQTPILQPANAQE